jgi:hypothetical protein
MDSRMELQSDAGGGVMTTCSKATENLRLLREREK